MSFPPSFPVVILIFVMSCSQVGTIKSMGIYLEDISWSLGTTSTDLGVALGLFTAFSYCPAPIVAAMYRFASMRRFLLITGSCMICVCTTLTAIAPNNVYMAVSLSMAGLGNCIIAMCGTLALNQLASKENFSFLYGLSMSGFGLGMAALPFLAEMLREAYGWRGSLLILGGLMANLVPCAVAIQTKTPSDQGTLKKASPKQGECEEMESLMECCDVDLVEREDSFEQNEHRESKDTDSSSVEQCRSNLITQLSRPSEEGNKFVFQANKHIQMVSPYVLKKNIIGILNSIKSGIQRSDYYQDPPINLTLVGNFFFGVLYCGWHAFLVPHALQRGYSIAHTVIMTVFASIGNFLGRLLSGALSGRLTNPMILLLAASLVVASAILTDAFIQNYYVTGVTACLTAVGIAGMSVLEPLVLKERASPDNFDVAYALNELAFGFGTFFGGYISGVFGDIFSTYNATFKFLAGVDILVFSIFLPLLFIKKPLK